MEQDGHLKSLAERMKEKAEQERIETEKVFKEQLQTLSSSLTASSQNALRIMSDAMAQEITNVETNLRQRYKLLSIAFGKQWICLAALGTALCLGMLAGGWTLAKAGAWRLHSYRTELAQLKTDCRTERETLTKLKSETWGLDLIEAENGRFIVLPPGRTMDGKIWTVGSRNAVRME